MVHSKERILRATPHSVSKAQPAKCPKDQEAPNPFKKDHYSKPTLKDLNRQIRKARKHSHKNKINRVSTFSLLTVYFRFHLKEQN